MGALICDLRRRQMKIYSRRGNIFQSAGVTFEARKTETRRRIDSCWAAEWQTRRIENAAAVIGVRGGAPPIAKQSSLPGRTHFFATFRRSADPHTTPINTYTYTWVCVCLQTRGRLIDWNISAGRSTSNPICSHRAYKYLPIRGQINHAENKSCYVKLGRKLNVWYCVYRSHT